ncbi:hypothetical protein T265_12010 [Opisthorchis viverrini]|uniref:Phosphoribosyltransferase domain-containing protein n=1 Tax=Opisthorchis viverrini TaxID=6198 RepID=A0A074ZV89_OPIVI|nr:hypothetical protein T265_12010 [Opisthorchis viverrini]KER19099.1 hypothetical protein T265_12010 [Opisthorchis viverrini]
MCTPADNRIILGDDYRGFDVRQFCLPPRYANYVESVLIPNGMLKDRIEKLALDIVTSFENDNARSLTLLCVLKGGFKFLADLVDGLELTIRARETSITMSMDFVRIKSYVNDKSHHEPILTGLDDPKTLKGKVFYLILYIYFVQDILVVEDIIDTGNTMKVLLSYLETLSPRSVRVASLLVKRTPLSSGYTPDFAGFEIPDRFVVGYAFDYNDHFRDMHIQNLDRDDSLACDGFSASLLSLSLVFNFSSVHIAQCSF